MYTTRSTGITCNRKANVTFMERWPKSVFLQFDMALAKLSKGGKEICIKCQRKGTIPIGLDGI